MFSMHRSASSPASLPTAGTAPQQQDLAMAEIANAVYDPEISNVMNGWSRVPDHNLSAFGTEARALERTSGLRAGVYSNGAGKTVVAFAGTDPRSGADLATDVAQELGLSTRQYRQADKLVARVAATVGKDSVVVVGHSLGGGLAATSALANGVNAVVFNAAGVHNHSLHGQAHSRLRAADGAVRHYHVDREALQRVNAMSPFSHGVPGAVIKLDSAYGRANREAATGALQMHSMDRVVSAMRTDQRFQGPQVGETARFRNAALPPWRNQDSQHTDVLRQIQGRDAARAHSYDGPEKQADRTRLLVRDKRHAAADISHGRAVNFRSVDQGHRVDLRGQQSPTRSGSPAPDSELADVMRRTGGSSSRSTTVEKKKGPFARFKLGSGKDTGKER
jgi:pimeloyl-ACP methyl ester carboxylesterase